MVGVLKRMQAPETVVGRRSSQVQLSRNSTSAFPILSSRLLQQWPSPTCSSCKTNLKQTKLVEKVRCNTQNFAHFEIGEKQFNLLFLCSWNIGNNILHQNKIYHRV